MNLGYFWLILGFLFLFLEFVIPGVILVFFGFGAIVTAIGYWIGFLPTLEWQLGCFCVTSVVSLFLLRRYFSRYLKGKVSQNSEFTNSAEFEGKLARVTKPITPGDDSGRVKFEGSEWKAIADQNIGAGSMVAIKRMNNITFTVEPTGQEGEK
jgi:inner membrane protein